jgi:hypothetical protein
MSYVIYIEETNAGYLSFTTEQEANDWLNNEPDFDKVKWTASYDLKCSDPVKED